jgi:nitroreductase
MTRAFDPDRTVPSDLLERLVDAASRAPSAGKAQGWHLVVLEGAETARFWDITLPAKRRSGFAWPGLLKAPVIALPLADVDVYLSRYAEPDKASTGLGRSADAWPVPYWTVDTAFALMTLLLAAEAEGLGALFFGLFTGETELRAALGIPARLDLLGAVALGWPAAAQARPGRSASRPRRAAEEIVHRGRW